MHLGEGAARLEAIARRSALLPLHDTRRERAEITAEMRQVEDETSRAPTLLATGAYVLGRGYLALRDPVHARTELERAREVTHEARVEEALGEALGELYRAALLRAQRVPVVVRDEMVREADATLRDPALLHLREAKKLGSDSDRIDALVALYERRYDDAIAATRATFARDAMAFEARELEGDVEFTKAGRMFDEGRYEDADLAYARAGEAFTAALAIARSSTTLYTKEVRRFTWQSETARALGKSAAALYAQGMDMAEKAIVADPDDPRAWRARAESAQFMAIDESGHGQDPTATFALAIASARRAMALAPDDDDARRTLADVLTVRGNHESRRGSDPTASLEEAIREYESVLSRGGGDAWYYNGLARAREALILYRNEQGLDRDPRPGLYAAIDDYGRAIERYPKWVVPHYNLCNTLRQLAEQELGRGIDPRLTLDRAADAADAALRIEPASVTAKTNRALVELRRGEAATVRGDDPSAYFASAMELIEDAQRRNPSDPRNIQNRGNIWLARADDDSSRGRDPLPAVREAVAAFEERARLDPKSYWAKRQTAEAWRIAAYDALLRGDDPAPAIRDAQRAIDAALRNKPNDYLTRVLAAEVELIVARSRRADGPSRTAALSRAEALAMGVMANDANNADALRVLAGVHRERARAKAERHRDPADEVHAALAACARVDVLLPGDARALALRGAVRMIDARTRGDAEALALSRADIDAAVARDARLAREHRDHAEL